MCDCVCVRSLWLKVSKICLKVLRSGLLVIVSVLGWAVLTMVRLTFEEAQAVARASKAKPGRVKANEILKECREKLQNRCGDYMDLEADAMFH